MQASPSRSQMPKVIQGSVSAGVTLSCEGFSFMSLHKPTSPDNTTRKREMISLSMELYVNASLWH